MKYNFDNLTPTDFEHLIADLFENRMEAPFERFKPGPDEGIDLRGLVKGKTVVVQAKRYLSSTFSDLKTSAKREAALWVERKQPDSYWFVTSLGLTPKNKTEILKIFSNMPITAERILSGDDVRAWLRMDEKTARAHMKLWLGETAMLEKFLNSAIYEQSGFEVDSILATARTFVPHAGVPKGIDIINNKGSLLVTGPPGIGKTTMARLILLDHIENAWVPMIVRDAKEAIEAVKTGEKRIIYFDDFLGSIALDSDIIRHSDHRINGLIERSKDDPNVRFLMTSRDYILNDAFEWSDRFGREKFREFKFVLQLPTYTYLQKARILFNHLYYSDLSKEILNDFVDSKFYESVIKHKNFNPRLISTMAKIKFPDEDTESYLNHFSRVLSNPEVLWEIPYESHFQPSDQLLVISLKLSSELNPWHNVTVEKLKENFIKYNSILKFNISTSKISITFNKAMRRMEGGMLKILNGNVTFHNPGVEEFVISRIKKDGHLLNLLSNASSSNELNQWLSQPYQISQPQYIESIVCQKLKQLVQNENIDTAVIQIFTKFDTAFTRMFGQIEFNTILQNYVAKPPSVPDIWDMGDVLTWVKSESSKIPVEYVESILNKLEAECELFCNDVERQYGDMLDEAEVYGDIIAKNFDATDRMIELGLEIADTAMNRTVSNWDFEDGQDPEPAIDTMERLGTIYGISVDDYIREIETPEPDYDDYDGYSSRLRTQSRSGSNYGASNRPTENEIVSNMFGELKS